MKRPLFAVPITAEMRYMQQLRRIAEQVDLVLAQVDPRSQESMQLAGRMLETYATVIQQWSGAAALEMLADVKRTRDRAFNQSRLVRVKTQNRWLVELEKKNAATSSKAKADTKSTRSR